MLPELKIMLVNACYCRQFIGTPLHYFWNWFRFFFVSKKMQREVINDISVLVDEEDPDIFFLAEIVDGWQKRSIINKLSKKYPHYNFSLKYPEGSWLRWLPVLHRNEGKMFFSKKKLSFDVWHLNNGTETGVFEIRLQDDLVVIMTHLSLTKSTRQAQHKEVLERYSNKAEILWLGDFNYTKRGELGVIEAHGFNLAQCEGHTFPAEGPSKDKWWGLIDNIIVNYVFRSLKNRILDLLFSRSKKHNITARTLRGILSDHIPVVWHIKRTAYPHE